MQETEITVEVYDDVNLVIQKLLDLGFKKTCHFKLNDWYYTSLCDNNIVDYEKLMKNSFLVRQVIEDEENNSLCYKNKILDKTGNVLSEEKITVKIDDISKTLKIFEMANLNCWCELKQDIHCYVKDDMDLGIQIIDGLGVFIEYEENESMQGLKDFEKINLMYSKIKGLGLNISKDYSCKKAYLKYLKDLKENA